MLVTRRHCLNHRQQMALKCTIQCYQWASYGLRGACRTSLNLWKLGTHCAAGHREAITSLRHYQLFQGNWRSLAEHWLGSGVLPPLEPDMLKGTRGRDPRRRIPVKAPRHKVHQLRIVAVVQSRVKWPRRWNTADLATSRLASRQLADTADTRSATVPTIANNKTAS